MFTAKQCSRKKIINKNLLRVFVLSYIDKISQVCSYNISMTFHHISTVYDGSKYIYVYTYRLHIRLKI